MEIPQTNKLIRDTNGKFLKGYHCNPQTEFKKGDKRNPKKRYGFSYICQVCNIIFYDKPSKKRKFCSKKCYGIKEKEEYEFLLHKFIQENTNQHSCKCGCGQFITIKKYHYNYGIPTSISEHRNIKRSPYSICQYCGIQFKNKSHSNSCNYQRKYCSHKCHGSERKKPTTIFINDNSNKHLCHCGCGQFITIKKYNIWLGIPKYIYRHHYSIFKGQNHPNWKNDKSFEPYTPDFNDQFKEAIRKRDGHTCQLCEITQEESGRKLSIHHIDYNKLNSFQQNCISLCVKCHIMTNYNRDEWKTFFQSLLKKKYGYGYTEDQKIILDFTTEVQP